MRAFRLRFALFCDALPTLDHPQWLVRRELGRLRAEAPVPPDPVLAPEPSDDDELPVLSRERRREAELYDEADALLQGVQSAWEHEVRELVERTREIGQDGDELTRAIPSVWPHRVAVAGWTFLSTGILVADFGALLPCGIEWAGLDSTLFAVEPLSGQLAAVGYTVSAELMLLLLAHKASGSPGWLVRGFWGGSLLLVSGALALLRFRPQAPVTYLDDFAPTSAAGITLADAPALIVAVALGPSLSLLAHHSLSRASAAYDELKKDARRLAGQEKMSERVLRRLDAAQEKIRSYLAQRRRIRRIFDDAEQRERDRKEQTQADYRDALRAVERYPGRIEEEMADLGVILETARVVRDALPRIPQLLCRVLLSPITFVRHLGAVLWALLGAGVMAVLRALSRVFEYVEWLMNTPEGDRRGTAIVVTTGPILVIAAVVGMVFLLTGCGSASTSSAPGTSRSAPTASAVVVLDRSDSTKQCNDGQPCEPDALESVFRGWSEATRLLPGSTFTVILAARDLNTSTLYKARVPTRWTGPGGVQQNKVRFVQEVVKKLRSLNIPEVPNGSDVVRGTWQAGRHLQESGASRRNLYIVSDLRDVRVPAGKKGTGWNLEARIPEPARFVELVRADGSLPALQNVVVVACGVHAKGKWSTNQHAQLISVWSAVFEAGRASSYHLLEQCDPRTLARTSG